MKIFQRIQIIFLAFMFPGIPTQAAGLPATLSSQQFYISNQPVEMTAYVIQDNNYIRLRDIGKAVNFYVFYDHVTDAVYMYNTVEYMEESNLQAPVVAETADAELSGQVFKVNNEQVGMTAYSIGGYNYVKLRDIGAALDFCVYYDADSNSVLIDKSLPYGAETKLVLSEDSTEAAVTVESRITEKILDGSEWSREDFSRQANPAIFDDVYTRGMYNAFRQSYVDRDIISAGNLEEYTVEMQIKPRNAPLTTVSVTAYNFNPDYRYANYIDSESTNGRTWKALNEVRGRLDGETGLYLYPDRTEPYVRNVWEYLGYGIIATNYNHFLAPANIATDSLIAEVNGLATDREKVKRLNDYLCTKLTYKDENVANTNETFTSTGVSNAICSSYVTSFHYLCTRANIPCVIITDHDHAWNEVYLKEERKWLTCDVTNNDAGEKSNDYYLLVETYIKQDIKPKSTTFAKEIVVPGSTAK